MYNFCYNYKENINRKLYITFELKKLVLKSLLASVFLNRNKKLFFQKKFSKFSKRNSISFFRNFCLITNWARSVFRKFKMSRHQSKLFASFGLICGLRKSSF